MRLLRLLCAVGVVILGSAASTAGAIAASSKPTTLTCSDESPPSVPPGNLAVKIGALALDGVHAWAAKPPAGLAFAYNHARYRLLKAFAYVLPKPPTSVTLRVVSPQSGVRLYYAVGPTWASSTPRHIVTAASSTVTFMACSGLTGYTGGILIRHAACVTLAVSQAGKKPTLARVPIAPARCP